jgi:hypothetical protein
VPSKVSHKLRDRALESADKEISDTLRARCGLEVAGISDLVNTRKRYPEAYTTLLELLRRDYPIRIREMIVRALTVADAHDDSYEHLLQLYTAPEPPAFAHLVGYESYRYALANALSVLARKADRRTLLELARDPRCGRSRSAFIDAMRRWKDHEADAVIVNALTDPDMQFAAIDAAAARGLTSTIPRIAELATSRNPETARLAKRALKKLQHA